MKTSLVFLFIAVLALAQAPGRTDQKEKKVPRLGFIQAKGALGFVDTDVFDEQKYLEGTGSDTTAVKAKRVAHEDALMREFMDGFNQSKECDGVILLGNGDNKPDFELQIIIDSHDTPGQKTVWNWVMRDMASNKILPLGFNIPSGKDTAKGICQAVWENADPGHFKKIIS